MNASGAQVSAAPAPLRELAGQALHLEPAALSGAGQPVILRGLVADWPGTRAGRAGRDTLLAYLRHCSSTREVLAFRGSPGGDGRYFYNAQMDGFNFERVTTTVPALLDELGSGEGTAPIYMGSTPLARCLPGFRADNDLDLGPLQPVVSAWLGNRSRIAAHCDVPDNIACVVAGHRRFTLFPPEQVGNLYLGPLDFNPAGQAISLVDFARPDFDRFPRFREALAAARVVELAPGDALFIPSLWWHHVEASEPVNLLINYWWRAAPPVAPHPQDAMVHALLAIRALPAAQRRAWEALFHHYVFAGNPEERVAHIPESRRGVLGHPEPGLLRRMRELLRRKLEY